MTNRLLPKSGDDAILALKPVTFRYKKEQNPEGIPQFGESRKGIFSFQGRDASTTSVAKAADQEREIE